MSRSIGSPRWVLAALLLVGPLALAGCIGGDGLDDGDALEDNALGTGQASWARPLPEVITGLEAVTNVAEVEAGAGLYAEGDHVYVAGQNTGFYILNVSTPEAPVVVGWLPDQFTRDVDLLHYDDGRTVAVAAASGSGMVFIDVTNVADPGVIGQVLGDGVNVHNVAVVPGTHIVYNSRSLDTPGVDIVDASDPGAPEVVGLASQELTCHDITFYPEGERAYCAGVTQTQIWDVSDPVAPEVVSRIVNPLIQIHHWALATHDGNLLIIGDEFGGSTDAAAGCLVTADDPVRGGTLSDPVGALWFYDISDEAVPTPISYLSAELPLANVPPTPCTSHFGALVEDRDLMVVGWRAAGTYLVDFSDVLAPAVVDVAPVQGDVWEARYHNGYIFTGDTDAGLDVLTFAGA